MQTPPTLVIERRPLAPSQSPPVNTTPMAWEPYIAAVLSKRGGFYSRNCRASWEGHSHQPALDTTFGLQRRKDSLQDCGRSSDGLIHNFDISEAGAVASADSENLRCRVFYRKAPG